MSSITDCFKFVYYEDSPKNLPAALNAWEASAKKESVVVIRGIRDVLEGSRQRKYLTAEDSTGKIRGIAVLDDAVLQGEHFYSIHYLMADPKQLKKGIGRALVDQAGRIAKDLGRQKIYVPNPMRDTFDFYEKVGFELGFSETHCCVIYEKSL